MDDTAPSLDVFEAFLDLCQDRGIVRATFAGMSVEFVAPAPSIVDLKPARELPPLPDDGPPVEPKPAPTRAAPYHTLFGPKLPTFQRKD